MKKFLIFLLAFLIPVLAIAESGDQLSQSGDHVTLSCPNSAVSSLNMSVPNSSGTFNVYTADKQRLSVNGSGYVTLGAGANGGTFEVKTATVLDDVSADAGTSTNAALIPAGSIVLGCNIYVVTVVTGATSMTIGDGTDADRWGTGILVAAGTATTSADYTITSVPMYAAATGVVLTAAGGGADFTAGTVRITCTYIHLSAMSS